MRRDGRQFDEAAGQSLSPGFGHPRGGGAGGRGVRGRKRLLYGRRHHVFGAEHGAFRLQGGRQNHSAAQRPPQRHQRARPLRRRAGLRQSEGGQPPRHFAGDGALRRGARHSGESDGRGRAGQQSDLLRHLLEHPRDRAAGARARDACARRRGARHALLFREEPARLGHRRGRGYVGRLDAQIGRQSDAELAAAAGQKRERGLRQPDHQPDPDDERLLSADVQSGHLAPEPCAARRDLV